jgi:serine/threonine protein phosphatase PrpC
MIHPATTQTASQTTSIVSGRYPLDTRSSLSYSVIIEINNPLPREPRNMKVLSAGKTDIGLQRAINEDSFLMAPDLGLYIVADGIGGQKAGDVASRMVVVSMERYWRKVEGRTPPAFLQTIEKDISEGAKHLINSISQTNTMIYKAQTRLQYDMMGSTVTAVLVEEDCMWAANVGDSRTYLSYQARLVQISQDHSSETQHMTPGIADLHDKDNSSFNKKILTRAVGLKEKIEVFIIPIHPEAGDIILMCSAGLTNYLSDKSIGAILDDFSLSLARKVDVLINQAKRGGGGDNITVILLQVQEERKLNRFKKRLR